MHGDVSSSKYRPVKLVSKYFQSVAVKFLIQIQVHEITYYLSILSPTYSSILPRGCPVHLSPVTSCTHFDTFNFAVTHSNRIT